MLHSIALSISLSLLIVPVIQSKVCKELISQDWSPGEDLTIPEGYSLADILMMRGEVRETIITNRQVSRYFLTFMTRNQNRRSSAKPTNVTTGKNQTHETVTMKTMLMGSTTWKFAVKPPAGSAIFKTEGVVQGKSLLVQMQCEERSSVCKVTSLGNSTVGVFSYDKEGMSQLLSTKQIRMNSRATELVNLTSISVCRAPEVSVVVEVSPGPVTVREGDSYSLTCKVRGLPVLAARWTKDGVELEGTRVQSIQSHGQEEQTLILTHTVISMSSRDVGSYMCQGRSLLVGEMWETQAIFLRVSGEKQNCSTQNTNDLFLVLAIVFGSLSAALILLLALLLAKKAPAKKKTPTIIMSTVNVETESVQQEEEHEVQQINRLENGKSDHLYTENTVSFQFDTTYDNHELYGVERVWVGEQGGTMDRVDEQESYYYAENTVDGGSR